MHPSSLQRALAGKVTAGHGALELRSEVGDRLSDEVRNRLNAVARQLTGVSPFLIANPVITTTATGVTVIGTGGSAALGPDDFAVALDIGPGDAISLQLSNRPGRTIRLHRSLWWSALALGLHAADGAATLTAACTGTLVSGDGTFAVSLATFDPAAADGDAATWSLALTGAAPGAVGPTPNAPAAIGPWGLTGSDDRAIAALESVVGVLSGLAPTAQLQWVTAGRDPGLRGTWPFSVTLGVGPPGQLAVTGTRLQAAVRPPLQQRPSDTTDEWEVGLDLDGTISLLGANIAGTVRVRHSHAGVSYTIALTPQDPSLLSVANIVNTFFGATPTALFASLPDGLRTALTATGFTSAALTVGPLPGAIQLAGAGTFLAVPTRLHLGLQPWLGGHAIDVAVRLDGKPRSIADVLTNDLALSIPASITGLLPPIQVAARELTYSSRGGQFIVGGAVAGEAWELDLRVAFGEEPGMHFHVGSIYGREPKPPTLEDLLDALMPGGGHTALLGHLKTVASDALHDLLSRIQVHDLQLDSYPGTNAPHGFHFQLVGSIEFTKGSPLVSSVAVDYAATPGGGPQWSVQVHTPFLRLDLVDLVEQFGLPSAKLGIRRKQLVAELEYVRVHDRGIELVVEVVLAGSPARLTARVERSGGAWDWDFSLVVGPYVFALMAHAGPPASYTATLLGDVGALSLAALADVLDLGPLPDAIDFALDEVTLVFSPADDGFGLTATVEVAGTPLTVLMASARLDPAPAPRAFALALAVPSLRLGLDQVPVIGHLIPNSAELALRLDQVAIRYSSLALDPTRLDKLNQLISSRVGPPSGDALAAGMALQGTLALGPVHLDLGSLTASAPITQGGPSPTGAPVPALPPVPPGPAPTPAVATVADPMKWSPADATLGPIHITRVGAVQLDGHLLLGVTGALDLAILQLTLIGLRVSMPMAALTDPARLRDAEFALDGLGVELRTPQLHIGGSLVRHGGRVDGVALLEASGFSLRVLASFTETSTGDASVFLYGVLDRAIGGPACCFVTGLAVGFGYNRDLVLPSVEGVPSFLLVEAAIGKRGKPQSVDDLVDLLDQPETMAAFPVRRNAFFGAIGVKFTTFKVVESFVLLALSIGHGTRISLLGTSTLELPPKPPDGTPGVVAKYEPPLARVSLAIKAVYDVERGLLDVRGALVGSYVFSEACTLTGGFAIVAHFKDGDRVHAGEFVATIGGYHPHFVPAPWHPQVDRLQLLWRVSPHLEVKGCAYFALTSGAAMAGGSLDAHWEAGGLSARFSLSADFLVQWQPYHYEAGFSIAVHGSLDLGGLVISLSVSAAVELYGPPFGGTATIDIGIAAKTIEFGAGRPPRTLLGLPEFAASFLPAPSAVCGASITSGAHGRNGGTGPWMVLPDTLGIDLHTMVPPTSIRAGQAAFQALRAPAAPTPGAPSTDGDVDIPRHDDLPETIGLTPCEQTATTPFAYAIVQVNGTTLADVTDRFTPTVTHRSQPGALWYLPVAPGAPAGASPAGPPALPLTAADAARTITAVSGVTLRPIVATSAAHPPTSLPLDVLRTELLNDEPVAPPTPSVVRLDTLVALDLPVPDDQVDAVRADLLFTFGFQPGAVSPLAQPPRSLSIRTLAVRSA